MPTSSFVKTALTALFSSVVGQKIAVAQAQWEIAKKDMQRKAGYLGAGAGMLAVAAVFMFFTALVLLAAAILGLALIMPAWAAALIVAGALFFWVLLLGIIGGVMINRNKEIYPTEQVEKIKAEFTSL